MERVRRSCWRRETQWVALDLVNATRRRAVALRGSRRPPVRERWRCFSRGKNLRSVHPGKRQTALARKDRILPIPRHGRAFPWGEIVFRDAPIRGGVPPELRLKFDL
jgi:hypothetical protein